MREEGQGQSEDQTSKLKSSERQIIMMLLLVTFGFLILNTPVYVMVFFLLILQIQVIPQKIMLLFIFFTMLVKSYTT